MYGFFYAVKQYFSFERKEIAGVLWTSIAFSFILTAFFKGFLRKPVVLEDTVMFLILAFIFITLSLWLHVAFQKVMAIKLGYSATYAYWLNGVLISFFFSFFTLGYVPFILPGSVSIEHIPKLRLGKFRYGTNLKDIARVSLAGPLTHIILVLIAGLFYMWTGATRDGALYLFIIINLFLAVLSCLPLPKFDIPKRMDAGSDGLGLFFFSRTIYVLVFMTIVCYAILILFAQVWSFILAFILGVVFAIIYSIAIEQQN